MLIVRLLPALPHEWATGRIKGLRTRGGFEAEIDWDRGEVLEATLRFIGGGAGGRRVQQGEIGNIEIGMAEMAQHCLVLSRTRLNVEEEMGWGGAAGEWGGGRSGRVSYDVLEPVSEGGVLWYVVDIDVRDLFPGHEVRFVRAAASTHGVG